MVFERYRVVTLGTTTVSGKEHYECHIIGRVFKAQMFDRAGTIMLLTCGGAPYIAVATISLAWSIRSTLFSL